MFPLKRILFATDFSDLSMAAYTFVMALARDYEAHVIVLHAMPYPAITYGEAVTGLGLEEERQQAEAALFDLPAAPPGVQMEKRVLVGEPGDCILDMALEKEVDLIVLGTHGRTGLARLLLGSVAEKVLRKAHCPVLTVKMPMPIKVEHPQVVEAIPV